MLQIPTFYIILLAAGCLLLFQNNAFGQEQQKENNDEKPQQQQPNRTFGIDKDRNVFLKDGQPFRYIAGEINYFRIHPGDWEDRLRKVRAVGLNAISVYLPWMLHQPTPETFDFGGQNNFTEFLRLAQKYELFVLLRVGPYVCAELEFGGLPWWLNKYEQMQLRTMDLRYLLAVKRYFDVLLPVIQPLLYKNGGPVLMVQIENEYGFRKLQIDESCEGFDRKYIEWLRDEVRGQLGDDVVLYATDPHLQRMKCSRVDGVYSTPDFGPQESEKEVLDRFKWQRNLTGGGPAVNSEFYTTWFTWWSNSKALVQNVDNVRRSMDWMWKAGASFSFYMIHGGSNFNFLGGNKHDWIFGSKEGPIAQSYDYAAPIDEAGQITPLYQMIREWIKEKPNWPNQPWDLPKRESGAMIENVPETRIDLMDLLEHTVDPQSCILKARPANIELLEKEYPLTLYSTRLNGSGKVLEIPGLADHGYVYLDGVFQGNLTNTFSGTFAKKLALDGLNASAGQKLDILVEHIGRLVFPLADLDHKGILSPVLLDGCPVGEQWRLCGVDVHRLQKAAEKRLEEMKTSSKRKRTKSKNGFGPAVHVAKFSLEEAANWTAEQPLPFTFFDTRCWGHGILVVNDFVVGRYWPLVGPQMSLFVPGPAMRQADNFVALIELSGPQKGDTRFQFAPSAIWEYPTDEVIDSPVMPRETAGDS